MRRNRRSMYDESENYKAILLLAGGILLIAIVTFFVVYGIYNNKVKTTELGSVDNENSKINISNIAENSTAASSDLGKTVNELKNTIGTNSIIQNSNTISDNDNKIIELTTANKTTNIENKSVTQITTPSNTNSQNENEILPNVEEEKEPVFEKPIEEGEIYREYAKENLVYSDTLQEWITHLGIDIKAPKTTVVVASEVGIVESIKNDPRYGLTVIVKHNKGYKTVYSNLLTSEFVNVGDEVKKGQSIGTVGNTASFEIADEPHLHFEVIKDNEKVDPSIYIK